MLASLSPELRFWDALGAASVDEFTERELGIPWKSNLLDPHQKLLGHRQKAFRNELRTYKVCPGKLQVASKPMAPKS